MTHCIGCAKSGNIQNIKISNPPSYINNNSVIGKNW